jgi:hypothetical protein
MASDQSVARVRNYHFNVGSNPAGLCYLLDPASVVTRETPDCGSINENDGLSSRFSAARWHGRSALARKSRRRGQ